MRGREGRRDPRAAADAPALEDPLAQLDFTRLPRHVAVIMDGNGRWARARHLPRIAGHRAGIAAVREVVEGAARLGIEVLTLYAFSRENWSRPAPEVNALMRLLRDYLDAELATLLERNIRFRAIGRIEELPAPVRAALAEAEEKTAANTGMLFLIALSYSGRAELADAARALATEAAAGRLDPAAIDESVLAARLHTADAPDPDLLIRSSGELRLSNFLLWQLAYSEIWVTPVLWPDFRRRHLHEAVAEFQRRERRFGGVARPRPIRGSVLS
ncbi:MAG: isoprenyl transferase [Acidobacteria bacterium]|nr:isoprenyl transferase [Acidobacteriota bacterium]